MLGAEAGGGPGAHDGLEPVGGEARVHLQQPVGRRVERRAEHLRAQPVLAADGELAQVHERGAVPVEAQHAALRGPCAAARVQPRRDAVRDRPRVGWSKTAPFSFGAPFGWGSALVIA